MNHSHIVHFLLTISFIAGLVPIVLVWVVYGTRSRWSGSSAGRNMFLLFAASTASYAVSTVVLLEPRWFVGTAAGNWLRIGIRFAIAAVFWNMLRLVIKAQRADKSAGRAPFDQEKD